MTGTYNKPYGEFSQITYDFQIILQVAKNHLRPTIPPSCPPAYAEIIQSCWKEDPNARPSGEQLLCMLQETQKVFLKEEKKWNDLRKKKRS
jgi:hypothetical protein